MHQEHVVGRCVALKSMQQDIAYKRSLPYSAGHAIQFWVLPCTGKPKVADLDEGRLLAIKQGVVQLHVSAVGDRIQVTCLEYASSKMSE